MRSRPARAAAMPKPEPMGGGAGGGKEQPAPDFFDQHLSKMLVAPSFNQAPAVGADAADKWAAGLSAGHARKDSSGGSMNLRASDSEVSTQASDGAKAERPFSGSSASVEELRPHGSGGPSSSTGMAAFASTYAASFSHNAPPMASMQLPASEVPAPSALPAAAPIAGSSRRADSMVLLADDDQSPSSHVTHEYHAGQAIEVWSNTHKAWCRGHVEKVEGEFVNVKYLSPEGPPMMKRIPRSHENLRPAVAEATRPATEVSVPSYRVGDAVEIFSQSHQRWCRGTVDKVEDQFAIVKYLSPEGPPMTKRMPLGHEHMRRATQVAVPNFRVGDAVEIYSHSHQRWCRGAVDKVEDQFVNVKYLSPEGPPMMKRMPKGHEDLRLATEVGAPSYRAGDAVEIYSNSHQRWCQGTVDKVEDGMVSVRYSSPEGAQMAKLMPEGHDLLRHAVNSGKDYSAAARSQSDVRSSLPPPPPPLHSSMDIAGGAGLHMADSMVRDGYDYDGHSPTASHELSGPEQAAASKGRRSHDGCPVYETSGWVPSTSVLCGAPQLAEKKAEIRCCRCEMLTNSYFEHVCPKCSAKVCVPCLEDVKFIIQSYRCPNCGDQQQNEEALKRTLWSLQMYQTAQRTMGAIPGIIVGLFTRRQAEEPAPSREEPPIVEEEPVLNSTVAAKPASIVAPKPGDNRRQQPVGRKKQPQAAAKAPPPNRPPSKDQGGAKPEYHTRPPAGWFEGASPAAWFRSGQAQPAPGAGAQQAPPPSADRDGERNQALAAVAEEAALKKEQQRQQKQAKQQQQHQQQRQQPPQQQHQQPPPPPPPPQPQQMPAEGLGLQQPDLFRSLTPLKKPDFLGLGAAQPGGSPTSSGMYRTRLPPGSSPNR